VNTSHVNLWASRIEDVHGNSVTYNFVGDRLVQITGDDTRQIVIGWNATNDRVQSVSANGRLWNYEYTPNGIYHELTKVTLPDSRYWQFGLPAMRVAAASYPCISALGNTTNTHTIRTPNGVTGTFTFKYYKHDKVGVDRLLIPSAEQDPSTLGDDCDDYRIPRFSWAKSIHSIAVAGAGVPSGTKTYTYQTGTGLFDDQTSASQHTKTQTLTFPDNTKQTYIINRLWNGDFDGLTVGGQTKSALNAVLETRATDHLVAPSLGSSSVVFQYETPRTSERPVGEERVTREGETYKTTFTYDYNTGSPTYSWGNPTRVSKSSSVTTSTRYTDYEYLHQTSAWILGLQAKVRQNGVEFDRYDYGTGAQDGLVRSHYRFGQLARTYTWHSYGQPSLITDIIESGTSPRVRKTSYGTWYRGVPTTVTYALGEPEAATVSRVIDPNGWVTSVTDGNGYVYGYDYSAVGWLKKIDRPAPFSDVVINYTTSSSGVVQDVTTNTKRVTTTYDGFLRPVLVKTFPLSGGGLTSHVKTTYDQRGRTVFVSLPSALTNPSDGTQTTFDALGRVIETRETFSNGGTTTYEYLTDNKIRVTDPVNAETLTTYTGYGSPDDGEPIFIQQPEGVNTAMTYDAWGNLRTARQYGTFGGYSGDETQEWSYNGRMELCRAYTPEDGSTLYQYDNAGQMTAYVRGQSGTTGCASLPTTGRVSHSYDLRGRLKKVDYADSTPDITYTYDDNSNVLTLNRANGANWSYAYNALNMLTDEDLSFDGFIYRTDYAYNTSGFLTSQKFPSGDTVAFAPNGLGQATQANAGIGKDYLTNVTYHVNGALRAWDRSNQMRLETWLDAGQRISTEQYKDQSPTTSHMLYTYAYTRRSQLSTVYDYSAGNTNRNYQYDGLGRVRSGDYNGVNNFVFAIDYDPLGNMRYQRFGAAYTYAETDANNRLRRMRTNMGVWGGDLNVWNNWSHDPRGNVTSIGRLNMGYDLSDQPTSVSQFGSGSAWYNKTYTGSYAYDGHKRRVKQVVDGKTIISVYGQNGSLLHRHNKSSGERTDFIRIGGRDAVWVKNGTAEYPVADYLGTVRALLNPSGSLLWKDEYTVFGDNLPAANAGRDLPSFAGHVQDSTTGLHYMQARFYEPATGRFLSIDPVGFSADAPQMFNRYSYALNDPVNMIDPDGEFAHLVVGFGIGLAVDIAVQTVVEQKSFSDINVKQALVAGGIGALSGGAGGVTAKGVASLARAAGARGTNLRTAAPKSLQGLGNGLVAGGASGGTQSALTQQLETGQINMGEVGLDAAFGALAGGLGGATSGARQGQQAKAAFGDARGRALFGPEPGSKTGAAFGVAVEGGINAGKEIIPEETY
jgi:RHS repeat-associated protein